MKFLKRVVNKKMASISTSIYSVKSFSSSRRTNTAVKCGFWTTATRFGTARYSTSNTDGSAKASTCAFGQLLCRTTSRATNATSA